jgi:hypothetical protein
MRRLSVGLQHCEHLESWWLPNANSQPRYAAS